MNRTKNPNWWKVKGRIIARFGTISAAAAHFENSTEGLRNAVKGKCPGILAKMEAAGLIESKTTKAA